jgi:nicotinate-nucleotide pyrophosphorylase (carboxylating)
VIETAALSAPPAVLVEPIVRAALLEDLGRAGDITTDAVVSADDRISAVLVARAEGRLAGSFVAELTFRALDPLVRYEHVQHDGSDIAAGAPIARLSGSARAILSGERTALNVLGRLSGIATATRNLVRGTAGTNARISDTRKTTPGLRVLEKYAVRAGGGVNHRFGLDDAALIKDNHIAAAGGVSEAVRRVRAACGHMVTIEIEVDTLDQLREALAAGVRVILLDNMAPAMLREAVAITAGRALLEASGSVTGDTVAAIAATGVDVISSGWITHSAPSIDVALDFV